MIQVVRVVKVRRQAFKVRCVRGYGCWWDAGGGYDIKRPESGITGLVGDTTTGKDGYWDTYQVKREKNVETRTYHERCCDPSLRQ